jgi:hypothetical protein
MRELIVTQTNEPQPNRRCHRNPRDSRRLIAVRGPSRRGTIMIFVLGVLVLLALIGLLLIARTHGESKRVSYEAAASSGTAAIDDVISLVRQTLRSDIWGAPGTSLPLCGNRPVNPANNPDGLLENNEALDAPGSSDRWLASLLPYLLGDKTINTPPVLETSVLAWPWVSYFGTDLIQGSTAAVSGNPFRWRTDARTGLSRATTTYSDQNLANVWILQTPPPGMTGYLIPGSTTNRTIAVARRAWEMDPPTVADGLPATMTPRFPYFDTNADGIIDLYDADGDGVPDSPISFVVPVKSSEPNAPKELYAVIRIVDHGAMLNVNVASSLRVSIAGASPTLTFDETTSDFQRRGRRMTELLLDETVHRDPNDPFGRPGAMALYRSGDDPVQFDAEIVRTMLAGGRRPSSSTFACNLYGLTDEASLRHRNMLVPPDRVGDRNPTGDAYCNIDRALPETLLWSRMPDPASPAKYDPSTPPRWNRLNSNHVTDANDPAYPYCEGYDNGYGKGWRTLFRDDEPLAVRRPAFTTVNCDVIPPPAGVTLDSTESYVANLSADPIRIVSGSSPAQDLYMSWPVLDKATYPNVPTHMRVLPIDINMSVHDPNDPTGTTTAETVKQTFIQHMAAAMFLALENAGTYQGFPLKSTSGFPQAQLNREYFAWQFAANMADYRDSDGDPTIIQWVYAKPGEPSEQSRYIFGVEKQPFLSEAYARLIVGTGSSPGGPSEHSEPDTDDKWFFAVELYVPPLWKMPTTQLYLHPTDLAPDPGLIPLSTFGLVSAPTTYLTQLDGGTAAGTYYVVCGATTVAPPSVNVGGFYRNNAFKLATNGNGGVELVWSPSGVQTDPLNHVLDRVDPSDSGGPLTGRTQPLDGSGRGVWARKEGTPDPGTAQAWSLLRSTKGWRFTTAWQVFSKSLVTDSSGFSFRPSLGLLNDTHDSLDDYVPESVWPSLVRFTPPNTYEEPRFPRPNGSGGADLVPGFTSGRPFEAFDSVGEISRMYMIGPINLPGGAGPPWGTVFSSTDTAVPLTQQLGRLLTASASGDFPTTSDTTVNRRCMAGRVDFGYAKLVTTVGASAPWSWRLLSYLTAESPLFDGVDNDGDGLSDQGDPTEGVKILNRLAGRININTAPPSVLRSIPFMSLLPTSSEYIHHGGTVANPVSDFTDATHAGWFWDFASAIVAQREGRRVPLRLPDATGAMVTVAEAGQLETGPGATPLPQPFTNIAALIAAPSASSSSTPGNMADIHDLLNNRNDLFATSRFWACRSTAPAAIPTLNEHLGTADWSSPDFRYRRDSVSSNGGLIDYIPLGAVPPAAPPYDNGGIRSRDVYLARWANMLTTRSDVFTAYIALLDENGDYVHRTQVTLDRSDCFAENQSDPLRRPILPRILFRQDGSYLDDTK